MKKLNLIKTNSLALDSVGPNKIVPTLGKYENRNNVTEVPMVKKTDNGNRMAWLVSSSGI